MVVRDEYSKTCPICLEDYSSAFSYYFYNKLIWPRTRSSEDRAGGIKIKTCCDNHICSECLYSHIKSVLEEGITLNGRTKLSCPLNCGSSLDDKFVRSCFASISRFVYPDTIWSDASLPEDSEENDKTTSSKIRRLRRRFTLQTLRIQSFQHFLQMFVFYTLNIIIEILLSGEQILFTIMNFPCSSRTRRRNRLSNNMKDFLVLKKLYLSDVLLKSQEEKKDLELYERWGLTIALNGDKISNQEKDTTKNPPNYDSIRKNEDDTSAEDIYTHVTKCPSPDCPCLFLSSKVYYNEKKKHEREYTTDPKKLGGKQSLFKTAKSYFYFKPIHPDREEAIMNSCGGYTTEHWIDSRDIDMIPTCCELIFSSNRNRQNVENDRRAIINRHADRNIVLDGRATTCPMCKHKFCNLCQKSWSTLNSRKGKYIFHTNQTCASYNSKIMSVEEEKEFLDALDVGDGARMCPSCSMRTDKIDGCNHMRCPCGHHWCWVCECAWHPDHYACTDTNPLIVRTGGRLNGDRGCVIS